jgi:hypothetical protein
MMIVQPVGDEVRLIRQHDHAGQCGALAAEWGAPPFRPVPDVVVRAVALHDAGWQEWDAAPQVDHASGLPYRFFEMPVAAHLAIFRRSVAVAAAESALAGLLVSLHAQGLYNGRFGLLPGVGRRVVSPEEEPAVTSFFGEQARLQDRLREGLGLSAIDPLLWERYRLLQLWDAMSLFSLASSPVVHQLPPVPTEDGEVTITMEPAGAGVIALDPWPFRAQSVETGVAASRIPACRYSDSSLAEALAAATAELVVIRFIPAR